MLYILFSSRQLLTLRTRVRFVNNNTCCGKYIKAVRTGRINFTPLNISTKLIYNFKGCNRQLLVSRGFYKLIETSSVRALMFCSFFFLLRYSFIPLVFIDPES